MSNVFQFGNDELKALCKNPTLERLLDYFNARTAEWPHSQKNMETVTVGVFFDLSSLFINAEAFDLLKIAAQFPWTELPDHQFLLAIDLLSDLASASNTTEIPVPLIDTWDVLESRISALDQRYHGWTHLVNHYRINK